MKTRRNTSSILPFEVSGRLLAIPIRAVEGVAKLPEIVSLPGNTSRVRLGISYILGKIMVVIDLAPLVNSGNSSRAREVVVIFFEGGYYAFLADSVRGIISPSAIQRPAKNFGGVIEGIATHEKQKFFILSPQVVIHYHVCN